MDHLHVSHPTQTRQQPDKADTTGTLGVHIDVILIIN